MKRDLTSAKKRLADLDVKLKRAYEDNILDFLRCAVCFLFLHQQYYEWSAPQK